MAQLQLLLLLLLLLLQTLNGIVHARGLQADSLVSRNEARKAMVRKIEEWGSISRQNMVNDKTEKTRVGMVSVKPFGRLGNAANAQNDTMREVGIAHSCPALKVGKPFSVFTDVVKIMNDLKAPYNLHAGTLLFFVRDCKLASDDFDFVVPLPWLQAHHKAVVSAFLKAGFTYKYPFKVFGTLDKPGYEIAWTKLGVKVDLFSVVEEEHRYIWTMRRCGACTMYNCSTFRESTQDALWGDILLRIPYPYEAALAGNYGKDWRKPYPKWRWYEDAFDIGNCNNGVYPKKK